MYSYCSYGVLFFIVIVRTDHLPYGYITPRPYGYNYWPKVNNYLSQNNRVQTPNYNVQTNEILVNNVTNEKISVKVFYESLCPDCIRGSNQLVLTVQKLAQYLDIKTYPYGNAQTFEDGAGHVTFRCQHGPKECYGNKLHACAIDSIGNTTSSIIFNACLFNSRSNDRAADMCGQRLGVNSETIKACALGERGTQLLKHYGEESKRVGFRYVPYVLINGRESEEDHLMQNVCKAFTYPPPECQDYL